MIRTEHGRIEGKVYITKRRQEHYFCKFKGFGISVSELARMQGYKVERILIIYEGKTGTKHYFISLEALTDCQFYKYNNDLQIMIPIKKMMEA